VLADFHAKRVGYSFITFMNWSSPNTLRSIWSTAAPLPPVAAQYSGEYLRGEPPDHRRLVDRESLDVCVMNFRVERTRSIDVLGVKEFRVTRHTVFQHM